MAFNIQTATQTLIDLILITQLQSVSLCREKAGDECPKSCSSADLQ